MLEKRFKAFEPGVEAGTLCESCSEERTVEAAVRRTKPKSRATAGSFPLNNDQKLHYYSLSKSYTVPSPSPYSAS
eukprot:3748709-Pleurochrysis_carterae.AAC.1